MFYILVTAPMDQVFVGPFAGHEAAKTHAADIRLNHGHDAYVLSPDEYAENIAEFGPLPIQPE